MMCVIIFPRAISHMMTSLLYPLVTFVLLLVCVAYWGATALYPFNLIFVCLYILVYRLLISLLSICLYSLFLNLSPIVCLVLLYNHFYSSSLKLMYVDIWPLQDPQSTEWWLSTQLRPTVRLSMALSTVTLR